VTTSPPDRSHLPDGFVDPIENEDLPHITAPDGFDPVPQHRLDDEPEHVTVEDDD
jgi:hypothetical protein